MKIAVINFSGNVGKSTIARHLLLPRIAGAELIAVESINSDEGQGQALRGKQFGELQEYLQTVESAVVDIGASNVEDLLSLMRKFQGSHEDFDFFVVPTVPARKQQQDTIATLAELSRLGVAPLQVKLVFNMVDDGSEITQAFELLLAFIAQNPVAHADMRCRLSANDIYGRLKAMQLGPATALALLARDDTDYKAQITRACSIVEKLALAQALATRRLARGVMPELDACFAALELTTQPA